MSTFGTDQYSIPLTIRQFGDAIWIASEVSCEYLFIILDE